MSDVGWGGGGEFEGGEQGKLCASLFVASGDSMSKVLNVFQLSLPFFLRKNWKTSKSVNLYFPPLAPYPLTLTSEPTSFLFLDKEKYLAG